MPQDSSYDQLMSGVAWEEFCDNLKMAGQIVMADKAPDDPLTRAEGFRYLSRLTRAALEAFVEYSDPLAPVLFRPVHETAKMGADNPDFYYQWAAIDGKHEYCIRGNRGSIHYLGFGTYAGQYGAGGRSGKTGYLEGRDLEIKPDGSFEIRLSCCKQEGNWLPMEEDTSSLIVRQMYLDREKEKPADLRIERVDGGKSSVQLSPEKVAEGLGQAGRLVAGASAIFSGWAEDFKKHVNQLPEFDQKTSLAAHGDPNICYYHSYWRLNEGEALLVEAEPPECDYWNFQLSNHWMESLDYRYNRISINKHTARYRDDGSVRIVVAHEDPGSDNWLTTDGHRFGTMCFRWVRAREHPRPRTRVVELSAFET